MTTITIPFEHGIGDTVYMRNEGYVRKGTVRRVFWASASGGSSPELERISYAVEFIHPSGIKPLSATCTEQYLFKTADEAFA